MLSTVSGTVFEDLDTDGVQGAGEPGLEGWTVVAERPNSLLATIVDPTPEDRDTFGGQIAALGDDILIGANTDDLAGPNTGAVRLYDGSTYELIREFPNPDPVEFDAFGGGALLAVGDSFVSTSAGKDIDGYENRGVAYLIDSNTGDVLWTIDNPSPGDGDVFGQMGAADGNLVAITALGDSTSGTDAGTVYVFDTQSRSLVHTILDPTPHSYDGFGSAIAMAGGNILIGARNDDAGAVDAGAAYLFVLSTGGPLQTYANPSPETGDKFGGSVAILGDRVFVGAWGDNNDGLGGAVYVFDLSTGTHIDTIENPTPADGDRFGGGLRTMDTNVLVGARWDDAGATDAGAAYLFDGSSGELLQTFLNPTPEINDTFGGGIPVIGQKVAIGAKFKDAGAIDSGAAYVFAGRFHDNQ